jgi:hypothetical protein
VKTGNGGLQNFLRRHRGSAQCAKQCATNKRNKESLDQLKKARENASKWFRPRSVPTVPSTVAVPALVHPAPLRILPSPSNPNQSSTAHGSGPVPPAGPASSSCPIGVALLRRFRARIEGLPQDVGKADENHPLAAFSANPVGCVEEDEDAWGKFDGPLNSLLQRPPDELRDLVRVGETGLIGLCRFLEYLVLHHNVSGYLLEGKLDRLMRAIDEV